MGHQIPVVVSAGSPFERGFQLGREQSVRVHHAVRAYMAMFRAMAGLRREGVYAQAERFLPRIEGYAPHLVEEMRGIAAGSGHDLQAIVALNCRTEILYGLGTRTECTAVGIDACASADGHIRAAQNWDWHPSMAGALVLWAIRREDGPDLLTLTEAGMVGKIGVNAAGLALMVNLLTSDTDHPGPEVPMHVILRRVLESASSVDEAAALLEATPRCSSCNHLLADATGGLADVEATPARVAVLRSPAGSLGHANHCLDAELALADSFARDKPDSLARGDRAAALAGRLPMSAAAIHELLSDHTTAPKAICRHATPEAPYEEQAATIASLIVDLTAGTLGLAEGPPCSNPYRSIRLSDLLRIPVPMPEMASVGS